MQYRFVYALAKVLFTIVLIEKKCIYQYSLSAVCLLIFMFLSFGFQFHRSQEGKSVIFTMTLIT